MRLRQKTRQRREPDLTGLINVIFLILIFFLIAGTLRPFSSAGLVLPETGELTVTQPGPGRLLVHANGDLVYRDRSINADPANLQAAVRSDPSLDKSAPFTLILDRTLEARRALELIAILNANGIANVQILAERTSR
jgi:biopolymer transport protein ExbD